MNWKRTWHPLSWLLLVGAILAGALPIAAQTSQIDRLKEAVENNPDDARSAYTLGTLLAQKNRLAEAAEYLTMATERDPEMVSAFSNLGLILRDLKRFDEAIAALQRVTDLEPEDAAAWTNLGTALQGAGRFEAAADAYRQATRLKPGDVEAQFGLAWMLLQTGQTQAAEEQYHVLAALDRRRADDLYFQYRQSQPGPAVSPLGELAAAVAGRDAEAVARLLQEGADPNQADGKGNPALHVAVQAGSNDIVALLIQGKADLTARDRLNRVPLHIAALVDNAEAARLLLEAGAAVDLPGFDSPTDGPTESTPLILAAQSGAVATAELLIKAGANVNALTNVKGGLFRRSPLFWAIKANQPGMVELLRKHGAEQYPPGATPN
ncbi:MAG: TPR domain/radical SAM/B12 binding domain protein [Candidatus Ozemobacter sibiricus]|uniref:TPR domain/radical SAM/B12 binding domain protein n=1 Tax=Candidatus Ozemobacter sibiricus TaxID=2268124 RepID=A0A367ZSC2_9BACT|nr:MAG: TPR domain/radical SAM/B12 binding domain protein [Candidatus Ozemobacter sibiricus]